MNISGGSVGGQFEARSGSKVNLFGTDFLIDGVALTEPSVGEAFGLTDRGVLLSGVLADGSPFQFDVSSRYFSPDATLTLTLVPEPAAVLGAPIAIGAGGWSVVDAKIGRGRANTRGRDPARDASACKSGAVAGC